MRPDPAGDPAAARSTPCFRAGTHGGERSRREELDLRTWSDAPPAPGDRVSPSAPASARAARAARAGSVPDLLFGALLAVSCVPIWVVAHVPTQDGGSHVETITALLRLPESALLQRHFLANHGLQPNWLTQILFALLTRFAAPGLAEKLVITGYAVLLPLALRAALPGSERGRWAALAIFPFVFTFAFHMGFWNFSYSLVLFLAVIGFWWRRRGRLGPRAAAGLSASLVATYFAHAVSIALALVCLGTVMAWRLGCALASARGSEGRRAQIIRGHVRRGAVTVVAALPALALLVAFLARQPRSAPVRPPLLDYATHFATLYALVSFDLRELVLSVAVVVTISSAVAVTLAARRSRRLRPVDGWLAAAIVAFVVYLSMPDALIDGAQLSDRLALFPWLLALVWLGSAETPLRRVRAVALFLGIAVVAWTAFRVVRYRDIGAYVAEYESVTPHVPEQSVILPLTFAPGGPRRYDALSGRKLLAHRIDFARHLAGYVATERHGVNLGNSQANTRHAPLRWRPEVNPFALLQTERAGLEHEPPCVALAPYERVAGPIDAVIVWGLTPASAAQSCGAAVLAEIAARYELAFVSPRGTAQLYLRRPGSPESTRRRP